MIDAAAQKLSELMEILRIDHRSDPNTQDTPQRVARMYVNELLAGRFTAPPRLTEFDCVETSSDLMVTGPIEMRSTCAHHLMPIYGSAIIGVIAADGRVIGLSKYDRVVHHFAR
ncbi:MAG TPA: GTP cyclohydrolase I, partial [Reyranella sp.]